MCHLWFSYFVVYSEAEWGFCALETECKQVLSRERERERKRERKGRLMEEHRQWDCQVASEAWHRPSIILADEHQKQREYQEWRSERKPDSKYRAAYWRCNFSRQLNTPWQERIRRFSLRRTCDLRANVFISLLSYLWLFPRHILFLFRFASFIKVCMASLI